MRNLPNETRSKTLDRTPHRKCILSGESFPPEQMVRLAMGPEGQIAPDVRAKAPGRGAWISVDRAALETALAKGQLKGALSRAFKTGQLDIPADLADQLENALERATLDRLGLEARGGTLLSGSEKIETAARRDELFMLLHASDAGQDGSSKLAQAWRVGSDREGQDLRGMTLPVDRQALSVALGRQNVVHIGIIDRRAAERLSNMLARWLRFIGSGAVPDEAEENVA